MLAKKLKRSLALLLSLVMVLGLLPMTAFAAYQSTADQIDHAGGTKYYSNTGAPQDKKDKETAVEVTKKVSPAEDGAENHFTIDLSVTTNQHVEEIRYSEDSAVVLVMDMSGSMNNNMPCPVCEKTSHAWWCSVDGFQSRLDAAKSAALSFLSAYHNSAKDKDGNVLVARYVSIMMFNGSGSRVLSWQNAATDEGYLAAKNAINGLEKPKSSADTNIEAGLLLARNNLNALSRATGKEIESRYVVLLSDGAANKHSKGDQDTVLTSEVYLDDKGNIFDFDHSGWAEEAAKRVKGTAGPGTYQDRAILYTVACGDANASWLADPIASSAQTALTAGNTAELEAAFTIISNNIETWAEAWVVTDPMGTNIAFNTATGENGAIPNTAAKFDAETGTLTWDLKSAKPTGVSGDGSSFTYSLSYDIILDTTGLEGGSKAAYPTNKDTTLTYVMVNAQGIPTTDPSKPFTATFDVPTVKGETGAFGFQKLSQETYGQDQKDKKPLQGAEFTLTHADDCACGLAHPAQTAWTVTSNDGGVVNFQGVPSGHTFVLKETAAPEGYALDGETEYTVTAIRGKVQVNEKTWTSDKTKVYNTLDPKAVTVTVTKTWQDTAAPEQRPEANAFTVTLTGNDAGKSTYPITNWTEKSDAVWTGTAEVPTVDVTNGQPISYDVTESDLGSYALDGSSSKTVLWATEDGAIVSGSASLTNTLQATIPVTVTKEWLAPEDMIPSSLNVILSAGSKAYNFTLSAKENWSKTIDVDLYADGSKLTYAVSETTTGLEGFEDPLYLGSQGTGFTIVNAVKQEYLTISGDKTWVGEKPEETQEITLTGDNGYTDTVALTNGNTSFLFNNVPKYDIEAVMDDNGKVTGYQGTGKEIVYTVSDEVAGFTKAQADVTITGNTGAATLKNIRDDLSDTIDITAGKVWVDEDNANNTRPDSVTLSLQRLEGDTWTDVDGQTAQLLPDDTGEGLEWLDETTVTFNDLPKYDAETGAELRYRVVEQDVPENYAVSYDRTDPTHTLVTNTLDSGEDGAKTSVTVTKVWKDPYTDDTREAEAVITLTGDNGYSETWPTTESGSHTFKDLPLYAGGKKVAYTASEEPLKGYTSEQSEDGLTFTNTIEQAKRDITVTKIWEDDFTDISNRPNIELKLYRDSDKDNVVTSVPDSKMTPVTEDEYTYTFENLDTYNLETGKEITYNVLEKVTGNNAGLFFPSIEGNMTEGFTVTNAFAAGETTVSGDKVWVRPAGVELPDSVTIAVYGADKESPVGTQEISADENGKWSYTFTGLPKNDAADGSRIPYTVAELNVPDGWTASVSTEDNRTITNTSDVLDDTIEYTVTKNWVGPESDRPETLAIQVYRSDDSTPVATYDLTAEEGWAHTFTLPKYVGSELAVYSAKEADSYYWGGGDQLVVQGKALTYKVTSTSTETGTDFTNTVLQDNTVTVAGEKFWEEAPVAFTAPEITVELWADSVKIGQQTVGEAAEAGDRDWTFSFENLPKYAVESDGHEIVYSVKEQGAANGTALFIQDDNYYYFSVTGGTGGTYDLTNTYTRTDFYRYKVVGEYTVRIDGNAVGTVRLELEPVKNAGKDANISRSAEDAAAFTVPTFQEGSVLEAYSGQTFTYNAKSSKPSVKLEKPNEDYEIVLKYTYDLTSTSYTVNHEYYVDGAKQDYLEGDTHTYSSGVYVGGVVSADSITAQRVRNGVTYGEPERTPDSLTLADAASNVFTFTYHYTTPPTPTFTLTVNHVDLEGNEAHKDIFKDGQPVTHKVTETATASPLNAETGLPAGYKLVKTSGDVEGKVSFDGQGAATVSGSDGDKITVTYYYGSADTVLITINYLMDDEARTPIAELPKQEITDYKAYDSYDVSALIYKPAAGAHGQYTYVSDSTISTEHPDGLYAGTLGSQDLTIDVLYHVESYPYKVVFYNDNEGTVLATVSSSGMTAPYGTVLTAGDMAPWFPENTDWVNLHRPAGYNSGRVTYPAFVGYSPLGILTTDPATGEEVWDHSPITNIVAIRYGYTTPSGDNEGGGDKEHDQYYDVTVRYLEEGTGAELAEAYVSEHIREGRSYNVSSQANLRIDGYTRTDIDGALRGTVDGDVEITVWYASSEINIDDNPVPEGDRPTGETTPPDGGSSDGGDVVDIPDGDVPLGDGTGLTGGGDSGDGSGETIIVDDRIPLGDLPQTGTTAVDPTRTLGLLALSFSLAAAGLAIVIGRKKEENEEA